MVGLLWWLLAVPAVAIAGYAMSLRDGRPVQDSVPHLPWLDEVHFVGGGIALLVGVFALRRDLLLRWRHWHRRLGYVYLVAVAASGAAGLAMAVFSSGGITAHLGFGALGVLWLASTAWGWRAIHHGRVGPHRALMIVSYSLCYAAVTLRLELPLLVALTGSFKIAYPLVSWTCWVPNLAFALWWLRRTRGQALPGARARRGGPLACHSS